MKIKSLSQFKKGEQGIVSSLKDSLLSLKLLDMGIAPGEVIAVEKFAPLGDPMYIKVGKSFLSIRKRDAAYILVEKAAPSLA